jgi:predicted esterase
MYIMELIENESKVVEPKNIIIGGFGQGAAMALLCGYDYTINSHFLHIN